MPPEPAVPVEALLAQRGWVRALARRLVADPAAADDLEQQAWLEALERPPSHAGGLRGWFATVLRRRARDGWRERERRGRREAAAARPEGTRPTAEVVAEAEAHRRVVDALMALEEPYRETVLLRFFEDLPPRKVAARLGVPVETVRTRTRRGLERLRERLDGGGGRAAWVAALVPLTAARWEPGAIAGTVTGGTVMASKAAVAAMVGAAVLGSAAVGVALLPEGPPSDPGAGRTSVRNPGGVILERPASASSPPDSGPPATSPPGKAAGTPPAAAGPAAPSPASAPPAARGREEDARRIAELQERIRALEAGREVPAPGAGEPGPAPVKAEDLRRRALDPSLSEEERVLALQALRLLPGGIDQAVIEGMVVFFREAARATTRQGLLRELHNTRAPELKGLFLEALRSDSDEGVRERAASDIDTYLDDAAVVLALESARDGDASEAVRRRAGRTLEKKGRTKD